jgi:hypothetical protein
MKSAMFIIDDSVLLKMIAGVRIRRVGEGLYMLVGNVVCESCGCDCCMAELCGVRLKCVRCGHTQPIGSA